MDRDPVSAFVEAINRGDVRQLALLMTEDHLFIDSVGNEVSGRATMMAGWARYFEAFRGYRLTVDLRFDHRDHVVLFGHTHAIHAASGREVRTRAACLALIKNGLIAEWCVFADNEPARAAMEGR